LKTVTGLTWSPDDECRAEHSERVHHLVECGVDLLLLETFNTIREAVIAARLGTITGTPVIVSFVPDSAGRILSGETLTEAASQLLPLGVVALGVNCGPAANLAASLTELRAVCGPELPLVAYGNIGYPDEKVGWINTDSEDPVVYSQNAIHWPAKSSALLRTTPAHISQLKAVI
jgi:S-methylmethionine-dependent homocysteine/selenocysteine methylase